VLKIVTFKIDEEIYSKFYKTCLENGFKTVSECLRYNVIKFIESSSKENSVREEKKRKPFKLPEYVIKRP